MFIASFFAERPRPEQNSKDTESARPSPLDFELKYHVLELEWPSARGERPSTPVLETGDLLPSAEVTARGRRAVVAAGLYFS